MEAHNCGMQTFIRPVRNRHATRTRRLNAKINTVSSAERHCGLARIYSRAAPGCDVARTEGTLFYARALKLLKANSARILHTVSADCEFK